MRKLWYVFILVYFILVACIATPEIIYSSVPKIRTVCADASDIEITVGVNGKIVATNEAQIVAPCTLVIDKVMVKVGEYVSKGDNLLKLNINETKKELLNKVNPDYESAQLVTDYITAPFSGTISSIGVVESRSFKKNYIMLKIIETESLQAVVRIGEDVISEIECGQPAIITGNGFKGKSYKGFVDVISAAAVTEEKSTQSMVETIISIDNPDKYLKSGYTVKVNVVTDIIKNAITIQSDTILQDDNNNEYVFVVSNGSAKKRFIKTGEYTSQGVIVTNGLQEGEVVALNPDELDGEIINVINLGEGE